MRLVRLERVLEGPHRLLAVVLLEEQLAPRRVHGDVGGRQSIGLTEEPVGVLKRPERASGQTKTQEIGRGLRVHSAPHQTQDAHGLAAAAELHVQQSELERRVTAWLSRGHRRQQFLGFGVAAARDLGARANRDRPCVGGGPQHALDLVVLTGVERAEGGIGRRGCRRRPALRQRHLNRGEQHECAHRARAAERHQSGRSAMLSYDASAVGLSAGLKTRRYE